MCVCKCVCKCLCVCSSLPGFFLLRLLSWFGCVCVLLMRLFMAVDSSSSFSSFSFSSSSSSSSYCWGGHCAIDGGPPWTWQIKTLELTVDANRRPIRRSTTRTGNRFDSTLALLPPPQPNDIQTFQKWIESDQSVSQLVWWTERWWQCESSRSDGWPRRGWWQLTEDGCIDPNGIIGGGAPRCGGAILLAAPLPSSAFSSSRRFKQAAFGFRFRSATHTHTPENDIRKTENSAADSSAAVSRPFISDRVDRQCNRSSWTTTNESAELNGRLKAAAARYHRYEIC